MSQQMIECKFYTEKAIAPTLKGVLFLDSSYFSISSGLGKVKNSGIFFENIF